MIQGTVTADGVPTVSLVVAGKNWSATIDTGFNGDLELPEALRSFVKPRFLASTEWLLAGG
jgi:predicted aspartyl protease